MDRLVSIPLRGNWLRKRRRDSISFIFARLVSIPLRGNWLRKLQELKQGVIAVNVSIPLRGNWLRKLLLI